MVLGLIMGLWFYLEKDKWKGFDCEEFHFEGRRAVVVAPKVPAPERPWIWRARFWGNVHQVDVELVERGFHLVHLDVAGLYGNEKAVQLWDKFYHHLRNRYQLNEKAVLEGLSRGGLIVYNWAAENTDKVACIYADAPVCDIKSWPGGLGRTEGDPKRWKECLAAYGLDDNSVLDFKGIPIYNAKRVAKAGIPVLHVCGDADGVVPIEENTYKLAEVFREAGGQIDILLKEGVGHHPHRLKDPTPNVEFILRHTGSDY